MEKKQLSKKNKIAISVTATILVLLLIPIITFLVLSPNSTPGQYALVDKINAILVKQVDSKKRNFVDKNGTYYWNSYDGTLSLKVKDFTVYDNYESSFLPSDDFVSVDENAFSDDKCFVLVDIDIECLNRYTLKKKDLPEDYLFNFGSMAIVQKTKFESSKIADSVCYLSNSYTKTHPEFSTKTFSFDIDKGEEQSVKIGFICPKGALSEGEMVLIDASNIREEPVDLVTDDSVVDESKQCYIVLN